MTDELVERMARAIIANTCWLLVEEAEQIANAALAALRKTHHLVPRATGDDGELVERLREFGPTAKTTTDQNLMDQAADCITALSAEVERLREALAAYTEYCDICHGRGSIIEEDAVTGKDLWNDCPRCKHARQALGAKP